MDRNDVLSHLINTGVVAVIRMKDTRRVLKVVEAIRAGGVKSIEITMAVPGAIEVIRQLAPSVPSDVLVGAGTVIDRETAKRVIDAGAKFVVGPVLNLDVIRLCRERDTVVIPGCFSATEIYTAWTAGADIVMVFPANSLGPEYFRDLRGPFPNIRLMPTGGVTIDNVGDWIAAGAVVVGIGSDLLDKKAIEAERYEVLTERAKRIVENFRMAKEGK